MDGRRPTCSNARRQNDETICGAAVQLDIGGMGHDCHRRNEKLQENRKVLDVTTKREN